MTLLVHTRHRLLFAFFGCGIWLLFDPLPLSAQFSPGPLSRAHERLEGSTNCTTCHEVGREISGRKCLACHKEISASIEHQTGYHFRVASQECVACHKEHLGKDAKTMSFDERTFDHTLTGFALTGKHARLNCESCHNRQRVTDPAVISILTTSPHRSYLGLRQSCAGCHADPHHGQFSAECASCHTTEAWSPARNFDHSKTKFPLEGKHAAVACEKCHQGMAKKSAGRAMDLATKPFADCTPCHTSPHMSRFGGAECRSCHGAEGWAAALSKPFDHRATSYALEGRHARLRCEDCHHTTMRQGFQQTFLLPHKRCTDCHADRHNGEFTSTYRNDCSLCHTLGGFKPSTFTVERHSKSRFVLAGAHQAVPCNSCHHPLNPGPPSFRFTDLRCESCHTDVHRGEFAAQMKDRSCGACHSTDQWSTAAFDHSKTKFPLEGKHRLLACTECHKEQRPGGGTRLQFTAIPTRCETCHADVHAKQFAAGGLTDCASCHTPDGWTGLLFDHNTRTSFPLTGGHSRVPCASCHHRELIGDTTAVRYRPVSTVCESCHQRRTGE